MSTLPVKGSRWYRLGFGAPLGRVNPALVWQVTSVRCVDDLETYVYVRPCWPIAGAVRSVPVRFDGGESWHHRFADLFVAASE